MLRGFGVLGAILEQPEISRPCFASHSDWFSINGKQCKPGLYWHGHGRCRANEDPPEIDLWVCSPIEANAQTCDEDDQNYGLLVRFLNSRHRWKEIALPMALLSGNGEEMRKELLSRGLRIAPEQKPRLSEWMMDQFPRRRITAATRTGWHDSTFVLPERVIGEDDICFQSENIQHDEFKQKGSLHDWKEHVSKHCEGNPILMLAVSAALAGPLLKLAKLQEAGGAGVHLVGDSSKGKSTALQVAASVWGAPSFVKTWRATANGLEATAASLNDTLIVLDEISVCDPKEVGAIIYSLANGAGKQRAARSGGTRKSFRWRIIALSSGERTLASHMAEGGRKAKAGQEIRMLDIPATNQQHGVFDQLHGSNDGRAFADYLKQSSGQSYGTAGVAFIKALLDDQRDIPGLYAELNQHFCNMCEDSLRKRAAGTFALLALASKLGTDYGITGWATDSVLTALTECFELWQTYRGEGQTETTSILESINDFIERYSDSRFSSFLNNGQTVSDRAGYWKDHGSERVFYFNSPALKQASGGFDIKRVLTAIESSGWLFEHDGGKKSKVMKVDGRATRLYAIKPKPFT